MQLHVIKHHVSLLLHIKINQHNTATRTIAHSRNAAHAARGATPTVAQLHCRTLPRALSETVTPLHTTACTLQHTAARTAAHCRAHCHTLQHIAAPTAAHCYAHHHTLPITLPHAPPPTAAHCRPLPPAAAHCRTLLHTAARTATHLVNSLVYGGYKWIKCLHGLVIWIST